MSLSNLGLDAFEAITELGTIVLASKKLGVTQTALTQRIKALETDLGCSLFMRSRRGMTPTREGQQLYEFAKERSQRELRVLRKLRGQDVLEPLRLRFAGPTMQTQNRVFTELTALKEKHPEVIFDFTLDDGEDLFGKLKNHQVDFVLTYLVPPSSFMQKKLKTSRFVLVAPYKWRKRSLEEITETESIVDFNPADQYTTNFLKKVKLLPKNLPERHFVNNTHQMLSMVESGLGYSVFDDKSVSELVKAKKICLLGGDLGLEMPWYLCWNNFGSELSGVYQTLIDRVN